MSESERGIFIGLLALLALRRSGLCVSGLSLGLLRFAGLALFLGLLIFKL